MTSISSWNSFELQLAAAQMLNFHQFTWRRQRPWSKHSSSASPTLRTILHQQPSRINTTLASLATHCETVTLVTFSSRVSHQRLVQRRDSAQLMLLSCRPHRAAFLDTAFPPSSPSTQGAAAQTLSYYKSCPPENSVVYGVTADFTLINVSIPQNDRLASHSTHSDIENQLWQPRRHYIHKHGIPAEKTCNLQHHFEKRRVTFLSLWKVP